MKKESLLYFILLFALFYCASDIQAKDKFVLVIDAGHGGKDPGAQRFQIDEKDINLSVARKLGDLIESNHNDIRVIYTRKSDRFIELDERANIANRAKADLFMSIHTNAVERGSYVTGTETFTLGLARTDENLQVAMRENSAILLEDNYLQKYEGFDPNSSESYIIFEFMQNKHMEQSVDLASKIQKSFTSANRVDRGVRQAGLLVLRKTSMPSVLVELGFISNKEEARYMNSDNGQDKLAQSLYSAFVKYKREFDRKQGALSNGVITDSRPARETEKPSIREYETSEREAEPAKRDSEVVRPASNEKAVKAISGKLIYKIQILTSDKKISDSSRLFKGYKNIDSFKEGGLIKYTYGESTNFDEIKRLRRKVARDFKDAFIIAFKNGEKVKY
ncbi:MAG: N-acetylmuramoyl-L-alanine amidase [Porphyromonadaceae bacterium]|nr:N-acetylmuramoyl-L-alanine amidase [Porphyromonadaceae bacterium]